MRVPVIARLRVCVGEGYHSNISRGRYALNSGDEHVSEDIKDFLQVVVRIARKTLLYLLQQDLLNDSHRGSGRRL